MTDEGSTEAARLASIQAVYDHSADQFVAAVGTAVSPRFEAPLDRALLDVFVGDVLASGGGHVLDVGCGPGRIAGHLAAGGVTVSGVDISPRMVEAARAAHPDLRFDRSTLTALPAPDASLAAAVYWYSIISTPPAGLPAVWRELGRVLRRDGQALIAFQAGDGAASTTLDAHGSAHTLTLHHHSPDHVVASLRDAGLDVHTRAVRRPQLAHECEDQAFVMCSRVGDEPGAG